MPRLPSLSLIVLLTLLVGCAPIRSRGGGSRGDDDDSASDDDDATGDDDDATGDDDDATPLSNPDGLLGATYSLDLVSATWIRPPGTGGLLASSLEGTLAVSPLASSELSGGTMELRLGTLLSSLEQDPCVPTSDVEADWTNPVLDTGTASFRMGPLLVDPAALQLTFGSTSSIVDGALVGSVDMRALALALGFETPEELCDLLGGTLGAGCTPCPDGAQLCLDVEVADVTGALEFEDPLEIVGGPCR